MTIPDEAVQAAQEAFHEAWNNNSGLDNELPAFAMHAAITAAAPFLQGVKVKALNWTKPPLSETLSRCETEFGTYRTWTHDEANGKWFWSVEGGYNEVGSSAKDEAAAKAAAQADYAARILSAIEVAPSPRAQAFTGKLVKQAMHEAWNDICYDTGCHPLDIHRVKRGELMFIPDHWASATYERLCSLSSQPVADGWLPIETAPEGIAVETKIDDERGERNIQALVKRTRVPGEKRPMFWLTDGSMYVYYEPTHWRHLPASPGASE